MTIEDLRPRTVRYLRAAGWDSNRRLDTAPVIAAMTREGYTVFPVVNDFLATFGNLSLSYPHYRNPTLTDRCHFDAALAAQNVFTEHVSYWSDRIGAPLCPVGEAFNDHMTVLMAQNGAVYGGFEETLVKLGNSGYEALNTLCEGGEPESIVRGRSAETG